MLSINPDPTVIQTKVSPTKIPSSLFIDHSTSALITQPDIPDPLALKLSLLVTDSLRWFAHYPAFTSTNRSQWVTTLRQVYIFCDCQALSSLMQSVVLVDRYMQSKHLSQTHPSDLILASCFLIASKQYEIYAPTCSLLCRLFKHVFTKHMLEEMEVCIIFELEWRLVDVLPLHFTEIWFEWIDGGQQHFTTTSLAMRKSDFTKDTIHYCVLYMLKFDVFGGYSPVVRGAAAVLIATRFAADCDEAFKECDDMLRTLFRHHIHTHTLCMDDIYACVRLMTALGIEEGGSDDEGMEEGSLLSTPHVLSAYPSSSSSDSGF